MNDENITYPEKKTMDTSHVTRTVDTDGFIRSEPSPATIYADERDPNAGGASHSYRMVGADGTIYAEITYQHGPRNEPGSTAGIIDIHVLAVVRDRMRAFQAGPFACRENALALTAIEEAMMWLSRRADERAHRGVLGKNAQ